MFYDAQEADTFTLTIPDTTGKSVSRERDRTDSQGSDDGSSSEGDPTATVDSSRTDSFLIVTDSSSLPNSRVNSTDLEKVTFLRFTFFLSKKKKSLITPLFSPVFKMPTFLQC